MKTIKVPKDFLELTFPWNVPHNSTRREYIDVLDSEKILIERALMSLGQLLLFLSQHQEPEGKSIPEEMTEYWNFTVASIARNIPTFEDFNLTKIEKEFFLYDVESPSEKMISEAAQKWLWTVANNIASSIVPWLEKAMKDYQDSELIEKYLAIASRYWHSSISKGLIVSLIGAGNRIAGERAIPLLEEVQQNSQDRELAKMARSYKRLMVDPNYG